MLSQSRILCNAAVRQISLRNLSDKTFNRGKFLNDYEVDLIRHNDPKTPVQSFESFVANEQSSVPELAVEKVESAVIGGIPEEHRVKRRVRIFKPAKESMQSGYSNTRLWKIEFDNRERWENGLMGWSSTADPLSNVPMQLKFATAEDAMSFCEKNQWDYEVLEPTKRTITYKNYGGNFSWDKRTRTGMK